MTQSLAPPIQKTKSWMHYPAKLIKAIGNTYHHYYVRPMEGMIDQLPLNAQLRYTLKKVSSVALPALTLLILETFTTDDSTKLLEVKTMNCLAMSEWAFLDSTLILETQLTRYSIHGIKEFYLGLIGINPMIDIPIGFSIGLVNMVVLYLKIKANHEREQRELLRQQNE